MFHQQLKDEFSAHVQTLEQTVEQYSGLMAALSEHIEECFRQGNKLLLCGNGGSAADAQHIAAEFINRFRYDRPALPAIALTTDTSVLTCIGNDSCFDQVFARQVEALARPGDILAGISTSGGSANVLRALEAARSRGVTTVGFTGIRGRETMGPLCDLCVAIPSADTARIQECHLFVWHAICGTVERAIFPQQP